ncbi:MAG: ATP-binding protein [Saprospiraceae bacterium]
MGVRYGWRPRWGKEVSLLLFCLHELWSESLLPDGKAGTKWIKGLHGLNTKVKSVEIPVCPTGKVIQTKRDKNHLLKIKIYIIKTSQKKLSELLFEYIYNTFIHMRAIIIILFFLCGKSFAQKDLFINIDTIPSAGLLLEKGWLYAPEINGQKPDRTNTSWLPIDPTQDIHDSIPKYATQGIGWMRLDFKLDHKYIDHNFAIHIQQSVAAEYHLNGKLLDHFGRINSNPKLVKAVDLYWSPLAFPLMEDSINTLEIRFAVQPDILYTKVFETFNPLTAITLFEHSHSINMYFRLVRNHNIFIFLIIGISLMICILHLTFYFVYPSIKANFWFGISRLIFIIGCGLQTIFWFNTKEVGDKIWYGSGAMILFLVMNLLTLYSIVLFLGRKPDKVDKSILILFFLIVIPVIFLYGTGWRLAPLFTVLVMLNVIRISILTWKKNKLNAQVLAFGAAATIVFFAFFILKSSPTNNSFTSALGIDRMILYFLYALSLPSAISILLASDFARLSISLKKQLIAVKKLSAINMASEREKQEILANQNLTLEQQVAMRTNELNQSLNDLLSTQAQLIQSEKMASLGELTAGIAHEIQNPLNFVNNFSELNAELIKELSDIRSMESEVGGEVGEVRSEESEDRKKRREEEDVIINDLKENSQKINVHGQRASNIVKGMLEHARKSSGEKSPTDINALCEEFAKLSYQSMRAKDPKFSAEYTFDFDAHLPKIEVVAQDLGRVILNLINNAFQALEEKAKKVGEDFKPAVTVSTSSMADYIEIRISDNGSGIPESIKDKIFQPFFTTKDAGKGTGLGLSLAYDIVKAHGGEIKVETEVEEARANEPFGQGSKFIIILPIF